MATPTITSANLNKAVYNPGEQMTLTVVGSDLDEAPVEVTVTLRTSSGETSEPVTVTATIDELRAEAVDSSGRVWTQVSRFGDTFTLTATA